MLAISDPAMTSPVATSRKTPVDNDLPPYKWTGLEFDDVREMDRAYYQYYEDLGKVKAPATSANEKKRPCFITKVFDPSHGEVGTEWRTAPSSGKLGDDSHEELFDICVKKSFEEAEEWRKERLAGFQEEIKGVAQGSPQWWKLQNKIKAYSQPLRRPFLAHRQDNEMSDPPHVDKRKAFGAPQDVRVRRGINPNVETDRRFEAPIRSMQKANVLPGEDGKWTPGTIWGPVASTNWADDDEEEEDVAAATGSSDRSAPSTFHGFHPRHHRPRLMGLGHHGFDDIFIKQRDGEHFTSEDIPRGPWNESRDAPILFETEDGSERHVAKTQLSEGSVVYDRKSVAFQKDLYTQVKENEKANKGDASFQGRSHAVQQTQPARGEPTPEPAAKPARTKSTW